MSCTVEEVEDDGLVEPPLPPHPVNAIDAAKITERTLSRRAFMTAFLPRPDRPEEARWIRLRSPAATCSGRDRGPDRRARRRVHPIRTRPPRRCPFAVLRHPTTGRGHLSSGYSRSLSVPRRRGVVTPGRGSTSGPSSPSPTGTPYPRSAKQPVPEPARHPTPGIGGRGSGRRERSLPFARVNTLPVPPRDAALGAPTKLEAREQDDDRSHEVLGHQRLGTTRVFRVPTPARWPTRIERVKCRRVGQHHSGPRAHRSECCGSTTAPSWRTGAAATGPCGRWGSTSHW
jgi:hypothetical protein